MTMTGPRPPAPVRALISLRALARNAALVRAAGATHADVGRDAWGHGLADCTAVLTDAGLGLHGPDGADTAADTVLADPRTLWGLPGGQGTPVMRLRGSLLSTKRLRTGEGVSYGYRFRAAHDTVIGLASGGYAQGIVRSLGGAVTVHVNGGAVPIIGRVAMDACVVDLEEVDAAAGDDVVFFGDPAQGDPELASWERATGLRASEIVSLVGARAAREVEL